MELTKIETEIVKLKTLLKTSKKNFDELYEDFVKMKENEYSYEKVIRVFGIPIIKIKQENNFAKLF